jgi:hypothetical protein
MARRVIVLFGPTSDAASWAPVGPSVTLLPFESEAEVVASAALKTD